MTLSHSLRPRAASPVALALLLSISTIATGAPRPRPQGTKLAQTFTVTNADDFGAGTLRQAILDANATPGADTITFALGGSRTIRPSVPLPEISDPVTIDATTQPGYAGRPLVEIDGAGAGEEADGLAVTAGGSTIRGLVVNGFSGAGIHLRGQGGNRVVGCYLGTNAAGTAARGNAYGVYVESADNVIGGTSAADRNVISGNLSRGIFVEVPPTFGPPLDNVIRGNFIGTDASGTVAVGNETAGIWIEGAAGNTIGGREPGAGNVISGNGGRLEFGGGIVLRDPRSYLSLDSSNTVEGNLVGTDATGTRALGNAGSGILVHNCRRFTVGGREPGAGNVVAYNGGAGVYTDDVVGTQVFSNTIFGNAYGGIVYQGPRVADWPQITFVDGSSGKIHVRGGLDVDRAGSGTYTYLIQFFVADDCSQDPYEPSSQGRRMIGEREVTLDTNGIGLFDETFDVALPASGSVTATATDIPLQATSPFAPCAPDSNGCERPFVTVRPTPVDVRAGQPATFSVSVVGSGTLAYQWYEVRNGNQILIGGATASTFTTPALSAETTYRVVVSNACGTATETTSATVCTGAPTIRTQPQSASVYPGQAAGLYVETTDRANATYQWYRGQSGDTSAPIANATLDQYGEYINEPSSFWVRVTNGCGSVDSATATLVPGPYLNSVKLSTDAAGKPQLVIKGSGFTDTVTVSIGNERFAQPPVVKKGKTVVQRGRLASGRSITSALPRGETVQILVTNSNGNGAIIEYTRP